MKQKKMHLEPVKVRVTWRHEVVFEVPADKSPDEVWGTIPLGDLDAAQQRSEITHHDYVDAYSFERIDDEGTPHAIGDLMQTMTEIMEED